jgi:serine/threonine protein kinase
MFKLISMADVLPRSLFITDITTLDVIGLGGFGRVFKGKHKGQCVALKVVDKSHKSVSTLSCFLSQYLYILKRSLREDFCREALTWRSLQHRFIIPLLGIYEEKSLLHLVSPFMTNGTLSHWRKNCPPIVSEIHRLVRIDVCQMETPIIISFRS